MNELEKTLQKILEKSLEIAEQTGNFAMEQAPILLQEFYSWHIVKNIFFVVIPIIFMAILFFIFRYLGKKEKASVSERNVFGRYYNFNNEWSIIYLFISSFVFIVSFIQVANATYNIIFILVAPKIYLVEYFVK